MHAGGRRHSGHHQLLYFWAGCSRLGFVAEAEAQRSVSGNIYEASAMRDVGALLGRPPSRDAFFAKPSQGGWAGARITDASAVLFWVPGSQATTITSAIALST